MNEQKNSLLASPICYLAEKAMWEERLKTTITSSMQSFENSKQEFFGETYLNDMEIGKISAAE